MLTSYDGHSISYDGSGNPTSYYNGNRWSFVWEEGRNLVTAASNGKSYSYTYDHEGVRTSKTVNGVTHSYIYASGKLLRETYGNTVIDFFYDANGRPYAMKMGNNVYYYILNLQGDVMRMVDASGTIVASYEYDPYGKLLSATGNMASTNPLRYRGYYYDTESGFYYLQSRYYDPQIGRFINADNVILSGGGSAQAYNLFAYCFNNPINMSDSSGNWPKLSTVLLDASQMALKIAVATAVIGVCALALPAVLATGAAIASCATVATAAFTVATCASGVSVAAATAAVVADRIEKKATKTYSVYFLEDESGTIRYVGRVTDSGYEARMTYHYNTRGLTPKYRASGLTYAQARGLEEIGIIECHTLNALYPQNNQIHGIGPRNKNGEAYLDAAKDYLVNRAENWLLNLIS